MKELQEKWMKLYLNLNMIKSTNAKVGIILEDFQMKLAMMNEDMMAFFDVFVPEE